MVEVTADDHHFIRELASSGKHAHDVFGVGRRLGDPATDAGLAVEHHDGGALVGAATQIVDRSSFGLGGVDQATAGFRGEHHHRNVVDDLRGVPHQGFGPLVVGSGRVDEDDARGIAAGEGSELAREGRLPRPASFVPEAVTIFVHGFETEHHRDLSLEVELLGEGFVSFRAVIDRVAHEDQIAFDRALGSESGQLEVLAELELEALIDRTDLLCEFPGGPHGEWLKPRSFAGVRVGPTGFESGLVVPVGDVVAGVFHALGSRQTSLHPGTREHRDVVVEDPLRDRRLVHGLPDAVLVFSRLGAGDQRAGDRGGHEQNAGAVDEGSQGRSLPM